jgi:hypothetical protein
MVVIPVLKKQRQENCEFKDSLGRLRLKKINKKPNKQNHFNETHTICIPGKK